MRIILGCTKDTPCVAMRFLLGFPTMSHRIKMARAHAHLRISSKTNHPLHGALNVRKGNRLKRGKSWLGHAEEAIRLLCETSGIDPGEEWTCVPRTLDVDFSVIVQFDRSSRELNPLRINGEVGALLNEHCDEKDAVIYTDGSVIRHVRCAWAFVAYTNGKLIREDSGAFSAATSSMTMEVLAVTMAFRWLETQDYTHVCILSDSLSMIRRVESGCIQRHWVESLQRSSLRQVTFIFVPGHAGVVGNERADRLAGTAAVSEGQPMDRSDIICALRELGRNEDLQAHPSPSIDRMHEMGLTMGAARKERYNNPTRRFINQQRTGTISRWTLLELLQGRSEHLWTCPECRDDNPSFEL
ncbi:hypothetical protein BsWGS_20225 [Bradybaena similaris]